MSLCSACVGISVDALNTFDPWRERLPYQHLSNAQDLPSSARTCPLCALILASVYQDYQMTNWKPITKYEDEVLESRNFGTAPIQLTGKETTISMYPDLEPVKALTGLHVRIPAGVGGLYSGVLKLYTKRGGYLFEQSQIFKLSLCAITSRYAQATRLPFRIIS